MLRAVMSSDWNGARGEKWGSQLTGMEAMLAPVDEPLLAALQLDAPFRIAEIGCGGGGTTIEVLRRAPKGSVVHGFDISESLVALARSRVPSGEGAIAFEVADMSLATPLEPYQRLVSRFGVVFFEDPAAAFANLRRWLGPGGRFAFAVWGPTSENPWLTSVRDVVARIVDLPRSAPNAPGPFRYAEVERLLEELERADFAELDVHEWRGALPIASAAFALASFSDFSERLAQAGEQAGIEAERALATAFSEHRRDGVVKMDAFVRIVTGTRRA